MIKCIKNDGFAQVKGNEDKIIKELLNNKYYDRNNKIEKNHCCGGV